MSEQLESNLSSAERAVSGLKKIRKSLRQIPRLSTQEGYFALGKIENDLGYAVKRFSILLGIEEDEKESET
ncbi:MAG: hypothetical protein AAF378_10610 [Cyanobacteria bacterium P01_A01_bin.84]